MKNRKRIVIFLLIAGILCGNSMSVFADEKTAADDTANTAENGEKENQETPEDDFEEDEFAAEQKEYLNKAKLALEELLQEETVPALVYLCDKYSVKKGPDEDSETVAVLTTGTTVEITGVDVDENNGVWYQTAFYTGNETGEGYIQKNYLAYSKEAFLDWEADYMARYSVSLMSWAVSYADVEQFPESYQAKLMDLKTKHPNWIFVKQNTGLNWQTVIDNENKNDRSLISNSFGDAYINGNFGQGWSYASEAAIKYYMDPRNFLDDIRIFQFEQLTFNPSYHTRAAVQSILDNTFMSGNIAGENTTYAQAFYEIGAKLGVSPFHLASRVYQEQGKGTSPLISGKYKGYEGYYNYFNVGASGATDKEVITAGLTYAKNKGWNSPRKSLEGGAAILAANYILKGQDTVYLQKFNVDGKYHGLYQHQYMQNICAPYTEAPKIKTAYANTGALDNPFVFKIPVYNNMPGTACPVPGSTVTPTPTATPAPTPTATPTATPKATAKPTAEPTATPKATAKPTAEPTATPKATAEPTATPKATAKPTAEPTATPKATAKPTAEPTATPKATAKPTAEPTATPKATAEPTAVPTATPKATAKPTAEPTATPKATAKPTAEPTATPKPTAEPTATPKATAKPTAVPTATPKPTAEPTATPKATAKPTAEPTATPKATAEPTAVPTATPKAAAEATVSQTASPVTPAAAQTPAPPQTAAAETPAASRTPVQTPEGEKRTVTMNISDNPVIYSKTLEQIKEQGVEAVLTISDTVSWTIDGSEIENEELKDINLSVTEKEGIIPAEKLEELIREEELYTELSLAHDGEFGFTAVLNLTLEEAVPGQYANLFYFNKERGNLEFMCASTVNEERKAAFAFLHASDYVVVIKDSIMNEIMEQPPQDSEQIAAAEEKVHADEPLKEEEPVKEPVKAIAIIIIILLACTFIVIGTYLIYSKRRK